MSDLTVDQLNSRDILARIDCNHAAISKLIAEASKLTAGALELRRERFLAAVLAAAVGTSLSAILPIVLRSWGIHL